MSRAKWCKRFRVFPGENTCCGPFGKRGLSRDIGILGWRGHDAYRSAAMMVACQRCAGRATTMLTYDHAGAHAYLDDVKGHERVFDGLMLCEQHAGRFVAPRGWTTTDRRAGNARLFAGEEE